MQPLIDDILINYRITEDGKIFSREREEWVFNRHPIPYKRFYPEKQLKTRINNLGYEQVGITVNGVKLLKTLHRLVAFTFIPNPNNLPEVNHIDGVRHNNHVDNLEWASRKTNSLHSTQILGKNRGESNNSTKLKESQVLEIIDMLNNGMSQTDVSKIYKITNHAIYRIQHGHNWSWLTGIKKG